MKRICMLRRTQNSRGFCVLFCITQKMILDHEDENFGVRTIDWESNSMDEKYFVARTCYQMVDSKSVRIFRFAAVSWRQNWQNIHNLYNPGRTKLIGKHNLLIILNWTVWDGERVVVEWMIFPRAQFAEAPPGSPKHDGEKITSGQRRSRTESSSWSDVLRTSNGAERP